MRTSPSQAIMIGHGVNGRAETFATVRAIASSTVLLSHAFVATIPGIDTPDYVHILSFSPGHHAVHIFFLLSGFFLTISLTGRRDAAGFLIGRCLRLYPAVIAGAAAAALLVGPIVTTLSPAAYFGHPDVWLFVVKVGSLYDISATLPGAFGNNPYPGILFVILWTLRYELVFCVGLALALKIGLLDRPRLVAVLLGVALLVHAWWFANGEDGVIYGSLHHFIRFAVAFGIGVTLALWRDRIPRSLAILALLGGIAALAGTGPLAATAGLVLLSYGAIYLGTSKAMVFNPINRLGQASYGVFVYGFMIEQLLAWQFPGLGPWTLGIAALATVLPIAYLSWHRFERPLLKLRQPIHNAIFFRSRSATGKSGGAGELASSSA